MAQKTTQRRKTPARATKARSSVGTKSPRKARSTASRTGAVDSTPARRSKAKTSANKASLMGPGEYRASTGGRAGAPSRSEARGREPHEVDAFRMALEKRPGRAGAPRMISPQGPYGARRHRKTP